MARARELREEADSTNIVGVGDSCLRSPPLRGGCAHAASRSLTRQLFPGYRAADRGGDRRDRAEGEDAVGLGVETATIPSIAPVSPGVSLQAGLA